MNESKEYLIQLISGLVEKPEAIAVDARNDEMGILLTLRVAPEDMGKVIGREGNTAKAIRVILRTVGMRFNARVNLKIEEPIGSTHVRREKTLDESLDGIH